MKNRTSESGSQLELDSLIIEYQNQFDRSNKLDNKVYITITFCGFLFVFIIGLFNAHLENMEEEASRLRLIGLYRQTINSNLIKLKHRCDEFA